MADRARRDPRPRPEPVRARVPGHAGDAQRSQQVQQALVDQGGSVLMGARTAEWRRRQPHRGDLLLLGDDDLLREAPELLVAAVAQLRLRHVDRALVVRHHHRDEVGVDVARRLDVHAVHHLCHGGLVLGQERRFQASGESDRRSEQKDYPQCWSHPNTITSPPSCSRHSSLREHVREQRDRGGVAAQVLGPDLVERVGGGVVDVEVVVAVRLEVERRRARCRRSARRRRRTRAGESDGCRTARRPAAAASSPRTRLLVADADRVRRRHAEVGLEGGDVMLVAVLLGRTPRRPRGRTPRR